MLGTVAVLLLNFDISAVEFVKRNNGQSQSAGRGASGFPTLKNNYAGNQVVGMDGDLKVRVRRRAPMYFMP